MTDPKCDKMFLLAIPLKSRDHMTDSSIVVLNIEAWVRGYMEGRTQITEDSFIDIPPVEGFSYKVVVTPVKD